MKNSMQSWRGATCAVTGGVGFLGSHLCARLYDMGARVVVLDREKAHTGTLFHHLNSTRDIQIIPCDLADRRSASLIRDIRPKIVFHLAASPYAPYTSSHLAEAHHANVVTTVNVLEGAHLAGGSGFVLASSACVFGAAQHSPLRLDDAPSPPEHYYSITKRQAEEQVRAFSQWCEMRAVICRFGNIYGPGDRHFGRIVPQICLQVLGEGRNALELRRSSGDSVFEFLFVDDAIDGILLAGQNLQKSVQTFQFSAGSESRTTPLALAKLLSEVIDGRRRDVVVNSTCPERRVEKYLDTASTMNALGWTAKWSLRQGLEITGEWYRKNLVSLTPHKEDGFGERTSSS